MSLWLGDDPPEHGTDVMTGAYSVVRALAIGVNAIAFWTEANFFARNWSGWREHQSFGYGLLLLSTVLAIAALAWPERYRGARIASRR
jgi:hypothetical protein